MENAPSGRSSKEKREGQMMTETDTKKANKEKKDFDETFINSLSSISKGDLAVLKRNAGLSISESRGVFQIFYRIYPYSGQPGDNIYNEEIYYLVATLFGHNQNPIKKGSDFGTTMKYVNKTKKSSGIDKKMSALLDSSFEYGRSDGDLPYRLTQLVKLANSCNVGVDWICLLKDLKRWSHPNRFVQRNWAKSYFTNYEKQDQRNEKETETPVMQE